MSKEIKFRINFLNHLEKVINLNNFIVNVEQGSMLYEINKGYVNLAFVTNKVYYDPKIIGDDIERIKVKWQIDGGEIQEELFCIEAIDYLKDKNIKVYCRSKSFRYDKYYINKVISGASLKEIFENLFSRDIALNFDNFTNLEFKGSLVIENKTSFDLVEELRQTYRFDYYYKQGVLYFCDKKSINKDDEAKAKFNEIKDIEDFNTSTDLFKRKIKYIKINPAKNEELQKDDNQINATLKLDISPEPQPCGPDEVLNYTDDDGNTYKISPKKTRFYIYFAPYGKDTLNSNIDYQLKEKVIVERYTLNNEDSLRVSSNIDSLIGLDGDNVSNYNYDTGDNLITFDSKISGNVKISYKSIVGFGTIENNKYPKNMPIKIKYLDREINFIHKIVLDGYYPTPYDLTLNTISDWGLDADNSINQTIKVSKYDSDNGAFVSQDDISSDEFGDFTLHINDYGTYKFELDGADPLFLDYFVNKKSIYMHELNC